MIKFLSVPGELLCNPDLRSDHKLILSYLLNLHSNNRYFYGSTDYLANLFGTTIKQIEVSINDLIKFGFVTKDAAGALRMAVLAEELYSYRKPTFEEKNKIKTIDEKISELAKIKNMREQVKNHD